MTERVLKLLNIRIGTMTLKSCCILYNIRTAESKPAQASALPVKRKRCSARAYASFKRR